MKRFKPSYFLLVVLIGVVMYYSINLIKIKGADQDVVMTIKGVFPHNDEIKLYYAATESFAEERAIAKAFTGNSEKQEIELIIPHDIQINRLRLDPGQNEQHSKISLTISLSNGFSSESVNLSDLIPNENVSIEEEINTITLKKVDGRFDPAVTFNENAINAFNKVRGSQRIQFIITVLAIGLVILASVFSPSPSRAILVGFISFLAFLIVYKLSKKIPAKENIVITLKAIIEEDDVFQAFILPESEAGYSEKFSMSQTAEGSLTPQTLVFTFQNIHAIKGVKIDIGNNKFQKPLRLLNIKIKGNGYLNQAGPKIYDHFGWNEFVTYNPDTQLLSTHTLKNSYSEYDPFIFMRDAAAYSKNQNSTINFTALILSALISISIYITLLSIRLEERAISLDVTFTMAFLFILVAPLIDNLIEFKINKLNTEKRTLAQKPGFAETSLLEYPLLFEKYYNDNVGFRNVLVDWTARLKSILFVSTVAPDKVLVGKDRWLFTLGEYSNVLKSIRKENPLTQPELDRIAKTIEERKSVLDSLHIKYYYACWPDKHTIYPEYMPNSLQWQMKSDPSRFDQVVNHLNSIQSPVKLLDVRPTLIAAKQHAQLYLKNDTHWNNLGAFYAYQILAGEIAKDFSELHPLQKESDYSIEWRKELSGDLLGMMGLSSSKFYSDLVPVFTPQEKKADIVSLPVDGYIPQTVFHRNNLNKNKLRVIVFRDSYTTAIIPFLSSDFYEVLYLWTGYDQKIIDSFKPDIVIEGFVERFSFYP